MDVGEVQRQLALIAFLVKYASCHELHLAQIVGTVGCEVSFGHLHGIVHAVGLAHIIIGRGFPVCLVVGLHLLHYLLEDVFRSHHRHLAHLGRGGCEAQSAWQVGSLQPHALVAHAGDGDHLLGACVNAELTLGVGHRAPPLADIYLREGQLLARLCIHRLGRVCLSCLLGNARSAGLCCVPALLGGDWEAQAR